MAEIKIEKKKQVWLWLLLGLGILAVFVYFYGFRDSNEEMMKDTAIELTSLAESNLIDVNENNGTVAAYVDFEENNNNKMSLDHTYTNEALLKLNSAIHAMADEIGFELTINTDKVKEYAATITKEPFDISHADSIREATDILTDALQNIQQSRYPQLANEVTELRVASTSINPDVLTLDQRDQVKAFFLKASALLKKMN